MGCAQSKIENEETVTRCKERKFFMKEAVGERNAFAAAHSAYAMSLKNTGAALSDYAQGEVPFPSSISASVSSSSAAVPGPSSALPQQSYDFPPPPPLPPLPHFSPPSLQRSNTAPEMSFAKPDIKHEDTILEDEEETDTESVHELRHRSSKSSGGGGGGGVSTLYRQGPVVNEVFQQPPSPPPSRTPTPPLNHQEPPPPPPPEGNTYWDFFSSVSNVPGPALAESDVNSIQSEEIERKMMMDERIKRSEINGDGGRKSTEKMPMEEVVELPRQQEPPQTPKAVKKVKPVVPVEGKRKAPVNVNLLQMFNEIDDCFLKAYQSANEVSKMLEANRLHYHSNFADNRGHIDHSARVMRVITWNRSFRGLPQPADDPNDDFDSEENETHATVLDKMLAWEKKLYDEVKAGEQMKLEYQRKVASLNKLKKRGTNTDALERMKAAVSHLHTRYIVDMQSMDSTVSEINRLRDEQLYPKLVALVEGMATMWENMSLHHQNQFKIVHALRSLDISQCTKETTDHHNGRTYQLHEVIKEWHTQCEKLMNHQKKYISALNHWLKLNLIPIDTNLREKVSSPQRPQTPAIQPLLLAWHDYLEKLPDELARTAIYNFSAVIHTIMEHQMDEIKLRDGCSETRKELERKTRQFEDWYRKRLQKKTPNEDETEADKELEKEQVDEKVFQLEVIKKRLEEEEEVYRKHCLQVREKSLTSLRQRLPELFRAMSDFSAACSDMYGHLRNISQMHNRSEGS